MNSTALPSTGRESLTASQHLQVLTGPALGQAWTAVCGSRQHAWTACLNCVDAHTLRSLMKAGQYCAIHDCIRKLHVGAHLAFLHGLVLTAAWEALHSCKWQVQPPCRHTL